MTALYDMKIYFIRHGETDWNRDMRFQGRMDTELNDTGRAQAARAAEEARSESVCFDRIYCSPLRRAAETAKIVTGKDPSEFIFDDRLKEMAFGDYEGTLIIPSMEDPAMKAFLEQPYDFPPPEGIESLYHVQERMAEALADILSECAKTAPMGDQAAPAYETSILICSHGMAISALFRHIYEINGLEPQRIPVKNARLYVSAVSEGIPQVPVRLCPGEDQ